MDNLTQEDIDWIRESITDYLETMLTCMQEAMQGDTPNEHGLKPSIKARHYAHAIGYKLEDVRACMAEGKPIPRVIIKESGGVM